VPRTVFADPPVLCGHRGSGRGVVDGHSENTLESFLAAVEAGVSWVEADARFNADDVLVARHDPIAEDGRYVSELTTDETDALGLLRVADLLDALPREVGVNIEIKSSLEDAQRPRERTTGALVADLVTPYGQRPLLVSSFDPAAVLIFRELRPEVPTGFLAWGGFPLRKAIPAAVHLGVDVVAPNVTSFVFEPKDGRRVEREPVEAVRVAHEAGLQVVAWCPKAAVVPDFVAAGVDCLIVDEVPAALAAAA
jgi:glycerophosphoryl diester phosphodiesterase